MVNVKVHAHRLPPPPVDDGTEEIGKLLAHPEPDPRHPNRLHPGVQAFLGRCYGRQVSGGIIGKYLSSRDALRNAAAEDVYQEGLMALYRAYQTFDRKDGTPFPGYAKSCVLNALRDMDGENRHRNRHVTVSGVRSATDEDDDVCIPESAPEDAQLTDEQETKLISDQAFDSHCCDACGKDLVPAIQGGRRADATTCSAACRMAASRGKRAPETEIVVAERTYQRVLAALGHWRRLSAGPVRYQKPSVHL